MKKNSICLLFVTLLAGLTGCSDWLDVNQNPNDLTSSTKELVLTSAQKEFAECQLLGQNYYDVTLYGAWVGYIAQTGGQAPRIRLNSYEMTSGDYSLDFQNPYSEELVDLKYVEEEARKEGNTAYMGVAKILTSVTYQRIVDLYGDIPYSEATSGFEGKVTPAYDDAMAIYDDLIVQIDSAILLLNQAIENLQSIDHNSDIIAAGNIEDWIRMANTYKLRILMRQTEAREDYVKANMSFDPLGFITSSISANPGYIDGTNSKMNPVYYYFGKDQNGNMSGGNRAFGLNVFLLALYNSTNDPRLELCWEPGVESNDYSYGIQLGKFDKPEDIWNHSAILMGPGIYGVSATDNIMVLSVMESSFLIAEALARGYNLSSAGIAGTAKEYWEAGIEKSFNYYGGRKGVSVTELISTYMDNLHGPSAWDDSNPVRSIIYQKYLANVGVNHYEAFADYRRTGYPEPGDPNELETSMISYYPNVIRDQVPVRLYYPQTEFNYNEENVNTAISKTGVTYDRYFGMDARIFWDVD